MHERRPELGLASGSSELEFHLLGPLEVLKGGRPLSLGGARQRAVLAVLLLHLNEAVGTERLVDAVWGDEAPLTAAKIVHNNVSQLRKLFERDVALAGNGSYELLLRHRSGYELRLDPERLDALVFERRTREGRQALTEGDPIVASAQLREALALWRGPALAEFAEAPFAQTERTRLEELRLAAIADRVEADLAGGRAAELVAELEAIVAEHPLRERLRAHLMLALYRAGRQAEALRVYQDTRRLLVDELGIDPSPTLQRLQRAILLQEPTLELDPPGRDDRPEPATPHRLREVRKTVSVLITEILPLGPPLDPEVLREPLARTLDEISLALERHGAAVDRTIGGAILAVFGIPAVHEDDPLRAVRAALDARRTVAAASERLERELDVSLALRAAVGTGDVLAGPASNGTAGLAGAAIDTALRLHGESQPNEILVADATRRLLRDRLRVQPLTRGVTKPAAWRLEDVVSAAPVGRGRESPLVGRERELDALGRAFERTLRERTPCLFTILGPAGIGKSRLAAEFAASLGDQATVLRGRCVSYGDGIALRPIAEMVEQVCGGDTKRLAGLLVREPDGALIAERIAAAVGLSGSPTSTDDTFRAVWKLVETLARPGPLVLIVDDLHWAAPTLLDLVEHVVDRSRAPVLVVCVARAELLDARSSWGGGKPNATSIQLGPLSDRESDALIGDLAAGAAIGRDTLARVASLAEGNPLFLEQMLAVLREGGSSAEVALPPTIHALLEARLDRLDVAEREVLERASVVGKEFWRDAVVELAPVELRGVVEEHLEALVRRDLIGPHRSLQSAEDGFEFRHVLLREVAYDSLPKRLRAELHERLALWLERSFATRAPELDELLGHHYEQAYLHRRELRLGGEHAAALAGRAAGRLASAGRRAYARDDLPAAEALLARAAALREPGAPDRFELLVDLGDALRETGDLERAAAVLAEAAEGAGDASDAACVKIARLRLQLQTDREVEIDAVSREAREAIAIFDELGQDRRLAKAWELLAWAQWFLCRAGQADAALQQAVACARRAGDRRTEAQSLHLSIGAMYFGPMSVAAAVRRCEEIFEQPGTQARLRASALRGLAGLVAWAGDEERAAVLVRSHRALVEELGLRVSAASAAETYGFVRLAAGDPAGAEAEFRRGYEMLGEMRERTLSALLAALLANALHLQGRDDEALEFSERSRDAAGADDLLAQVQWRTARAKPLAGAGRQPEAETLAREALGLVRTTDFPAARADAAMDLAEVLCLDGRDAEASRYVQEALALYEQKGWRVAAARARARLVEVAPAPGSTVRIP